MSAVGRRKTCRRCGEDDVEFDTSLNEYWCTECDDWADV